MMTMNADRPFYVLYRNTSNGHKGRRTFRTRKEQVDFIWQAPFDYAITAYN